MFINFLSCAVKVNGPDQPVLVFEADQYLCLLQCIRLILPWDGYYLTRNRSLGLHSVVSTDFVHQPFLSILNKSGWRPQPKLSF